MVKGYQGFLESWVILDDFLRKILNYILIVLVNRATSKASTLIREAQNQLASSSIPSLSLAQQPSTPQTPLSAQVASPMVEDASSDLQIVDENGQPVDWQNDPNEPRYCLCNQVSYGDMVGCDNDDVSASLVIFFCVLR